MLFPLLMRGSGPKRLSHGVGSNPAGLSVADDRLDNAHSEFHHAPGDRLLLQLGRVVLEEAALRAWPSRPSGLSFFAGSGAVITESECPG